MSGVDAKAEKVRQAVKSISEQVDGLNKALVPNGTVRAAITTSSSPEGVSVADLSKKQRKGLKSLRKEKQLEKGIMSSIAEKEAASMGGPKRSSEPRAKLPSASRHEERASAYQSAMSGAFTPKGPMTPSGLELDRPKPKAVRPSIMKSLTSKEYYLGKSKASALRYLLHCLSKSCMKAKPAEPDVLSHQPTAHQDVASAEPGAQKEVGAKLKKLLEALKKQNKKQS